MKKTNIINHTDKNRFKPIMNNHIYDEKISYEDVLKELKLYIDKGFGGIAINGRSRNFVEDVDAWLPKYFETVKKFCKGAKELGLDMWIFDEWGFPSGSAAGLVLNGENRVKRLNKTVDITIEKGKAVSIPVPDRFVSAGAMRVSRFAAYHAEEAAEILKSENGMINYTATEKTRIVIVTYEDTSFHTMEMRDIKNMDLNDPTVGTPDIMDFDTVKGFIRNMHERYKDAIGEEFGKTVKGFFYDEPEIYWEYPYSPGLPQFFKRLHGYDMEEILPELMAYLPCGGIDLSGKGYHRRIQKLFSDYREACTEMLKENFYGQLEEWCHENNLLSVGHQDMDDNIASINTISGDLYKNSSRNDMPGIDVIHADIAPEIFTDFPRYAGSIKRLLNKPGAMSETFGVMGEDMPPNTRRYVMEHQIMRGIDTFFLLYKCKRYGKGRLQKRGNAACGLLRKAGKQR